MKKIICFAVAALLAATCCACSPQGGNVSLNETTAPETTAAAPTQAETTQEPTLKPAVVTDFVETMVEKKLPGTNRLLIMGEENGDGSNVPNRIPRLLIDSTDAVSVNNYIEEAYVFQLERLEKAADTYPQGRIDYVAFLNSNILSLAIEFRTTDTPTSFFDTFNFDVITGKELSYEEVANLSDKGYENAQNEVKAKINEIYDGYLEKSNGSHDDFIEQQRAKSLADENLNAVKYYYNENGELVAAFRYYGIAGAETYGEIAVLSNKLSLSLMD